MQQIDDLKHGMNFRVIDAKTEIFSRQGRVYKTPAAILSREEFIQEYPGSTDFFSHGFLMYHSEATENTFTDIDRMIASAG